MPRGAVTDVGETKVVVVGAGLAGVTAAYALARRSVKQNKPCSITVVDRRDQIAVETSYANAGRFCATSLAMGSPAQVAGIRRTLIPRWLKNGFFRPMGVDDKQPLLTHMKVDFSRPRVTWWGFCALFLQNPAATLQAHRLLAQHAVRAMRENLSQLTPESVNSMAIRPGTLYLYNRSEDLAEAKKVKADKINSQTDFRVDLLSSAATLARFPWLCGWKQSPSSIASGGKTVPGALYVPQDWSADAREYVLRLAEASPHNSDGQPLVRFRLNTRVQKIVGGGVEVGDVQTGTVETIVADVVIVACGAHSVQLIPNGHRRMPLEPLRGFSIDLYDCHTSRPEGLPNVACADFSSGDLNFQITPYEDGRIRLVGFADFVGRVCRSTVTSVRLQHKEYSL